MVELLHSQISRHKNRLGACVVLLINTMQYSKTIIVFHYNLFAASLHERNEVVSS